MTGRISGISGPAVTVTMRGLTLHERVSVGHAMLTAEVVRLGQGTAVLQVYENTSGLSVNEPVSGTGKPLTVQLGPGLLHQVFDGLQRPLEQIEKNAGPFLLPCPGLAVIDCEEKRQFMPLKKADDEVSAGETLGYVEEGGFRHLISGQREGRIRWILDGDFRRDEPVAEYADGLKVFGWSEWPVRVPRPYRKKLMSFEPLMTGQRCIDFLFPFARGGTAIMPGGFGTGKTILQQVIAKFANTDIVVYVGCGERGNEMAELIDEFSALRDPWSGRALMERTILVVNTSNMPVAARESSIYTAVTMAEYYRDMGYHVLLLADSLSRWAEALREISSSLEEMPGEEGYPTYLASRVSAFCERAGTVETLNGETGSLSMILSVSPPGGDFTEPVTQACLRTAGAFLMLDTALAHRRHFPSINWVQSYSLYEKDICRHYTENVSADWEVLRKRITELLQRDEAIRDVVEIIGFEGLQDADKLLVRTAETVRSSFLCQNAYTEDAFSPPAETMAKIKNIMEMYDSALLRLDQGEVFADLFKA